MMPTGFDPKHLLWADNVDENTYQKRLELFVAAILYLECEVVRLIPSNLLLFIEPCSQTKLLG
jgi:hypothetical protein